MLPYKCPQCAAQVAVIWSYSYQKLTRTMQPLSMCEWCMHDTWRKQPHTTREEAEAAGLYTPNPLWTARHKRIEGAQSGS